MKAFLILFLLGLTLTATFRTKLHSKSQEYEWLVSARALEDEFVTEGAKIAAQLEVELALWERFW